MKRDTCDNVVVATMTQQNARTLDPAPPPRGVLHASARGGANGRMEGRRVLPSPEIAAFVHHYWLVEWDLETPFVAETLPHPAARIEIEATHGAAERAEVVGVRTARFRKRLVGAGQFFGVQFRAAAFQPLLRAPMVSITDRAVPVASVFGNDAAAWAHSVRAEPTLEAKVARVEAWLRPRVSTMPTEVARMRDLVERIAYDREMRAVEQVAECVGVDVRTLQRRFRRFVGAHPKWVIQCFRLIEAAAQLEAPRPPTLAALAARLGYADQAHFQRDFRAVVGRTPGAFARERSSPNGPDISRATGDRASAS